MTGLNELKGSNSSNTITFVGTSNGENINLSSITTVTDVSITIDGKGGGDTITGTARNDTILAYGTDSFFKGGTGTDTLKVASSSGVNLSSGTFMDIETVDISDGNLTLASNQLSKYREILGDETLIIQIQTI